MASTDLCQNFLPKDLMEVQLGQADLLMAMYASDDAVALDDASDSLMHALKSWCESDETKTPIMHQTSLSLLLSIDVEVHATKQRSLQLDITLPLVHSETDDRNEPPKPKVRVLQPEWMSKAEVARFGDELPDEDLLTIIHHAEDEASRFLSRQQQVGSQAESTDEAAVRAWFYFPSISTRTKRDDIVNHAPRYGLTGFLLAGKPGILCLEGGSQAIDDYMKFIKTESWGDIPSQHKKVSERYRESGPEIQRVFPVMQEITDEMERRGERANRNDMRALEAWLDKRGVGEAFAKVLI